MNDEKKAIVLDTNFIIEHKKDLRNVVEKLSSFFDVYVTQISISERLSQKYLELKKAYERIEELKEQYSKYVTIRLKKTFEEKFEADKKYTSEGYVKQFGNKIIPFNPSENVLKEVMDRVFMKAPPFVDADKASDKGFKDTLLWISLLDYFKHNKGYNNITFVTRDKGFINYIDVLQTEFLSKTGTTIIIKDNDYYSELIADEEKTVLELNEETSTNDISSLELSELRKQISTVIENICSIEVDYHGDQFTFISNTYFQNDKVQNALENMDKTISDHILESSLWPSTIWGPDFLIQDSYKVPIENVHAVSELYKTIKTKHIGFMTPFLNAVCGILNVQYRVPFDEEQMPF
jgi:hypothetical protein